VVGEVRHLWTLDDLHHQIENLRPTVAAARTDWADRKRTDGNTGHLRWNCPQASDAITMEFLAKRRFDAARLRRELLLLCTRDSRLIKLGNDYLGQFR
jgi:hypothetical protein